MTKIINQEKEIIKALQNDDIINYIDCNYWNINHDTLIDLFKETLYLLPKELYNELINNLIEYRDFCTEETKEEEM